MIGLDGTAKLQLSPRYSGQVYSVLGRPPRRLSNHPPPPLLPPPPTNDTPTTFPELGRNSGIPTDVTGAVGAVAAADQNGIQAGRDSLSSAITTDRTTLLGKGTTQATWPTALSS